MAEFALVLDTVGQTRQALGRSTTRLSGLRTGARDSRADPVADDPNVATSLNNLALLLHLTGACARAEPLYQRRWDL